MLEDAAFFHTLVCAAKKKHDRSSLAPTHDALEIRANSGKTKLRDTTNKIFGRCTQSITPPPPKWRFAWLRELSDVK